MNKKIKKVEVVETKDVYCEHCDRFTKVKTSAGDRDYNHGWYCQTNPHEVLVQNLAIKVRDIIDILEKHFN
jgi:protein-disulfide isomerase